ncbi:MAG: Oxidoreductase [Parcubacteria group bacterium GW2011_GWB1_49_7]|nr:MAG: Oxidoreductase [Parcubacteria group bacterium GW2011_GWA1_47_10]KKW09776.1 MAG: Oxidoreductase [Parcubacteria group bacterium GW2011_GWB1_49_7]
MTGMILADALRHVFKGEVIDDDEVLETYSRDASLFKVRPKLVVYPKDAADLAALVQFVHEHKSIGPEVSLTIRAAGSDMSGGPLGESIVADVTKHMNRIGEIHRQGLCITEPGAFYRDFEKKTLEKKLILPCYPASKNLCALGGMIANNCAGEKTLRYGKMEDYVVSSKYIFSDGHEYEVKPLSKAELEIKMAQGDFEGNLYTQLFELLENNKEAIRQAKPNVSKNSAGYYLWNIYPEPVEGLEGMFDLNKLLTGAQGTLGIMTEATVQLVSVEKASELFVIFIHDLTHLPKLINAILPTKPDSIESYDDATMKLAVRFFPEMLKSMKPKHFFSLIWSFVPEAFMILKGGIPKLILLVEYSGSSKAEVDNKMEKLEEIIHPFKLVSRKTLSEEESEKYWTVRRESFNLLRKHIHGARTAPFVDDVVVRPEDMAEFLPKMKLILDEYKLNYTIAGHAGNGNFHIIPLMNMKNKMNVAIIKEAGERIYNLVREYKGSITGEHNDGIVRTPYLNKMYSPEILELFKKVKHIFDPLNIFNPGKKVNGTIEYLESHIALE